MSGPLMEPEDGPPVICSVCGEVLKLDPFTVIYVINGQMEGAHRACMEDMSTWAFKDIIDAIKEGE